MRHLAAGGVDSRRCSVQVGWGGVLGKELRSWPSRSSCVNNESLRLSFIGSPLSSHAPLLEGGAAVQGSRLLPCRRPAPRSRGTGNRLRMRRAVVSRQVVMMPPPAAGRIRFCFGRYDCFAAAGQLLVQSFYSPLAAQVKR